MTDLLDNDETLIYEGDWVKQLRNGATPSPRAGAPRPAVQATRDAHGGVAAAALVSVPPAPSPPARPTHASVVPAPPSALPREAPRPSQPSVAPSHVAAQSPLFRHEAMRASGQGHGIAAPLDVAPRSTWLVFLALFAFTAAALAVAVVGHVELTSLGRGVMRAPEGVQPVTSPLAGVIAEVLVEPGASVAPGQVILRIDSTQTRAQLLDVERKLAALDERHAQESVQAERLYHSSVSKLRKRRALIERRIRSQRRGVERLTVRAERFRTLADEGLSDHGASEDASEALDNAERAWLALQDQLALADVELSKLEREREAGRAQRREERERTVAERDAVRVLLEETEIRASHAGKLEGLRVSVGQQVQPGGALARLVPLGAPERVVAFMPERDRAFLREGRSVRLELDRLPVGEFGSLVARVDRISNDVAAAEEIETHLGQRPEGTLFRVDLSLAREQPRPELLQYLQSGTLVTVRAPLRSRRIVELLFDPIRRFLKE